MPPFYEGAAHLMLFLTRAGLVFSPTTDCRAIVARLAQLMLLLDRDLKDLTHYGCRHLNF